MSAGDNIERDDYRETEKFQSWYDSEKAKGLVDVKFFTKPGVDATVDDVLAEVNTALDAKEIPARQEL